jgi:hypothetical protein
MPCVVVGDSTNYINNFPVLEGCSYTAPNLHPAVSHQNPISIRIRRKHFQYRSGDNLECAPKLRVARGLKFWDFWLFGQSRDWIVQRSLHKGGIHLHTDSRGFSRIADTSGELFHGESPISVGRTGAAAERGYANPWSPIISRQLNIGLNSLFRDVTRSPGLLSEFIGSSGLQECSVGQVFRPFGLLSRLDGQFVSVTPAFPHFFNHSLSRCGVFLCRSGVNTGNVGLVRIDEKSQESNTDKKSSKPCHSAIKAKLLLAVFLISLLGVLLLSLYLVEPSVKDGNSTFNVKFARVGVCFTVGQCVSYLIVKCLLGLRYEQPGYTEGPEVLQNLSGDRDLTSSRKKIKGAD